MFYTVVTMVYNTELMSFQTSSIVQILKNYKIKHYVLETGSVSILRWGETPTLLGPLERANLNHWTQSKNPLILHL
jgi:hypothetical protein